MKKTIKLLYEIYPQDHPTITTAYNSIGLIYFKLSNTKRAIEYFEKALNIWEYLLPENGQKMFNSCKKIWETYVYLHDFKKALKNSIVLLLDDFIEISAICRIIGIIYFNNGDFKAALIQFETL